MASATASEVLPPTATASATATVAEVFPSTATALATAQKSTYGRPLLKITPKPLQGEGKDFENFEENMILNCEL